MRYRPVQEVVKKQGHGTPHVGGGKVVAWSYNPSTLIGYIINGVKTKYDTA